MATAPILDPVEAWDVEPEPQESGMTMDDLVTALKREADAAEHQWEDLRDAQELARKYYEAKPFGNEVLGRSQIVLPDVQETIDYMAVSVLRTFVSGDRIVEFEAVDESDEDAANEATAAIGHSFMRRQDGYRVLHDWCVSGLLDRYGVAKTMMVTEERVLRETVQIGDPVELEGIDAEIEGVEEGEGGLVVSLKRVVREKRSVDAAIPPEEFRFSPLARHEDEADYLAHCPLKTRSELVDMGFDREQVYDLPAYTKAPDNRRDNIDWQKAESTPATEEVQLWEEYARIDIDGDGIAERVKVFRVDTQILRWADGEPAIETVEEQPFAVFCPFPRPHRLVGYSLADKVMDIQLSRSTVARQLFDGMYNANMPRPVVVTRGMDENTIDDLLSPIAGSPIRVTEAGAVQAYQTQFDVGKSLTVLEWVTGERESRTGITRLNQGLDADTLNKTATGTALMQAQGQQQEEFIARNLAEAFSRLMLKKYRMMRSEGEPFRVKVDGKYKQVDPAMWPEDVAVGIRVGLGTGSKEKRIQARMAMVPLLSEGFAAGQVEPKHLFHAMDGLVRDLGLGEGDDFWIDPDAPPELDENGQPIQKDEKPDPEQMAMEAEQQREDAKLQLEARKADLTLQMTQAQAEAKIELMREEAAAKLELERQKAASEAEMNMQRMAFEMQQAREQAEFDREMARENARAKAEDARIAKNRPGGDLDK